MGMRIEKVKSEFGAFRDAMRIAKHKGRKWHHRFINFFVEKNRHMPYFWGHVEPFLYAAFIVTIVELSK